MESLAFSDKSRSFFEFSGNFEEVRSERTIFRLSDKIQNSVLHPRNLLILIFLNLNFFKSFFPWYSGYFEQLKRDKHLYLTFFKKHRNLDSKTNSF